MPCIDEMLSDSEDAFVAGPADWYFSMVYDTGSANITSQAMCRKLPSEYIDILVDDGLEIRDGRHRLFENCRWMFRLN